MVKTEYDNTYVEPVSICGVTSTGSVKNVLVDAAGVVQTNATLSSATVVIEVAAVDTTYTLSISPITISAAGVNTVVAAPGAGHAIKVYKLRLVADALVTIQYKSGASNISGPMLLLSIAEDFDQFPITCGTNEAFVISLGSAVAVNGYIVYRVT